MLTIAQAIRITEQLSLSAVSTNTESYLFVLLLIVLKGKLQLGSQHNKDPAPTGSTANSRLNEIVRPIKDSDVQKSHSSIIAETVMINNHYGGASGPKVLSGLISQLNSSAEQLH